ncbi:hatching enzyme 1.2 [Anastrepha obliqua]|uniref:hatching enzyme 1.2 n=1 Tax=Anastrepha obliqua TaxID=95512 RepID=UPI00240952C7|nr:hatching enzyme 1.2 [Anastrepha obliqua]
MLIFYAIGFLKFFTTLLQGAPARNAVIDKSDPISLTHVGAHIFGKPHWVPSEILTQFEENSTLNPEEVGPYLEGDMLVPYEQTFYFRNGLIAYSTHWPGAVVPYIIQGDFNEKELARITHAFHEYHNKTCVRFKPRTYEHDYLVITNHKTGCWSSVGRLGGRQEVNLQTPHCFHNYGTSMHELMHSLGFMHEQNRPDRDNYIRVLRQNVKKGMLGNFAKGSPKELHHFGVSYDYASVMHYSKTSFSKNGQPTIEALKNTKEALLMGQRNGFSKGDVAKLNAMYKCV